MILHAGLIALHGPHGWRGVLIQGPSGVGKSDLALRGLDQGFRLVADDRVRLWPCAGRLYGASPAPIHGLIEARGLAPLAEPALAFARIVLVAACRPAGAELERLPEPLRRVLAGVELPVIDIQPLQASAPAKLRRALHHLGAMQ